jgi:hypothetical protein
VVHLKDLPQELAILIAKFGRGLYSRRTLEVFSLPDAQLIQDRGSKADLRVLASLACHLALLFSVIMSNLAFAQSSSNPRTPASPVRAPKGHAEEVTVV